MSTGSDNCPVIASVPSGSAPNEPCRSAAADTARFPYGVEREGGIKELLAGDENGRANVEHHAIECGSDRLFGRRQSVAAELQADRRHAAFEIFEDRLVRGFRIGFDVERADIPAEAVARRFPCRG